MNLNKKNFEEKFEEEEEKETKFLKLLEFILNIFHGVMKAAMNWKNNFI